MAYHHQGTEYRWRLSRAEVDQVLHYTHWIPNARGSTAAFFNQHYPGGTLGTFVAVFRAAGILLTDHSGSPHGGRCHWRLRWVYFNDTTCWAVDWDDQLAADDGQFLWHGQQVPLPVDQPPAPR